MDLFFHSPCFDGITSAVLTSDFFERHQGVGTIRFHAVDYDQRSTWLARNLGKHPAVVDFLFHPDAAFWADHHATTFLAPLLRRRYRTRMGTKFVYDPQATSCSILLWKHFWSAFRYRNHHFAELVGWADRIDSARYRSVQEAVLARAPALQISRSLLLADEQDCVNLVVALRTRSLKAVAGRSDVRQRVRHVDREIRRGLDRFRNAVHIDGHGIVTFDVDASNTMISRYAPYVFYPKARYSAGILRTADGAKITAMRNPWRRATGIPLGKLFERFGGGGHQRIGSVVLRGRDSRNASRALEEIVSMIRGESSSMRLRPA